MIAYAVLAALAGGAIALAYGYRGQRDQEREQVVYLRSQLREARGLAPSKDDQRPQGSSRALTTVGTT